MAAIDPHRRQRIPTQVEERVIDPDPLDTQYPGVDAGQNLLDRVGRGAISLDVLVIGSRQRAGVEFAVRCQRQRVDHHHRSRNHIGRQPLGQRGTHPGRLTTPVTDPVT